MEEEEGKSLALSHDSSEHFCSSALPSPPSRLSHSPPPDEAPFDSPPVSENSNGYHTHVRVTGGQVLLTL